MAEDANHVNVMLRVRPLLPSEAERGEVANATVLPDNKSVMITAQMSSNRKVESQQHLFDFCFGPTASQEQVFEESGVREMIHLALEGIASTILCFGQTGSGKTYTLNGPSFDVVSDHAGIQYRAVQYVAAIVHQFNVEAGSLTFKPVTLRASYMEIYQENINDLLNDTQNLKCRWSKPAQAFFVENLMIVECLNSEDLVAVLQEGNNNRKRASHNLNVDSSRSHVIFTMYFERREAPDAPPKLGRIHFVDLAGSEKLKDSESSGVHEDETKAINKSLFALGNVIQSLSKAGGRRSTLTAQGTTASIVPYRDSTLTKLLMDSLGGSCKTLMVACISPSNRFTEESIRTIQYAQRTKNIVNTKPVVRMNAKQQSLYELKVEVEMLRKENLALRQVMAQAGLQCSPSALEAIMGSITPAMSSAPSFSRQPQQSSVFVAPQHAVTPGSFYRAAAAPQLPSSAPLPLAGQASASPFQPLPASSSSAMFGGAPAARASPKVPLSLPPMQGASRQAFVPSPPAAVTPTGALETAAMMMAEKAQKDNEALRDEVSQLRNLIVSLRTDVTKATSAGGQSLTSPSAPSAAGSTESLASFLPKRGGDGGQRRASVSASQDSAGNTSHGGDVPNAPPQGQVASAPPALQATSSLTDFGFRPAPKKAQRLQWGPAQDGTLSSLC
jgi:hypothetical protein